MRLRGSMDILDQVDRFVSDLEKREGERPCCTHPALAEVLMLTEMVTMYNRYIATGKWDCARECLQNIARLATRLMSEQP